MGFFLGSDKKIEGVVAIRSSAFIATRAVCVGKGLAPWEVRVSDSVKGLHW